MMHCGQTVLSKARACEVSFSMMDALTEEPQQADIFQHFPTIYLHCVDTHHPLKHCRITALKYIDNYFCHLSFLDSLPNRRICILANSPKLLRKLHQLDGIKSAFVINVISSAIFKVSYTFITHLLIGY